MRKKVGSIDVYVCDFEGCTDKKEVGHHDLMFEVIFGIHPDIYTALYKKLIITPVIQRCYHFCQNHYFIKEVILGLIADCYSGPIKNISTKAELVSSLGCWITINDRFSGERIKNFQLPHSLFVSIHEKFLRSLNYSAKQLFINYASEHQERVAELCKL